MWIAGSNGHDRATVAVEKAQYSVGASQPVTSRYGRCCSLSLSLSETCSTFAAIPTDDEASEVRQQKISLLT